MTTQPLMRRAALLLAGLALAAGCATRQPAPVIERAPAPAPSPPKTPLPKPEPEKPAAAPIPTHTVKRGETLVSIALQYGIDYRDLAAWNGITNPNQVAVGKVLFLSPPPGTVAAPGAIVAVPMPGTGSIIEARPLANTDALKVEPRGQRLPYSERALAQLAAQDTPPVTTPAAPPAGTANAAPPATSVTPAPAPSTEPGRAPAGTQSEAIDWIWPVKGKLISAFTEASKGIDFDGKKGSPVVAAASGRVVYAGQGLRGYGKLVIVKHSETWLSAYAHNDNVLVKEQQEVKRGQKIAEMGSTDADRVKLHFEVRRQGKPVDPLRVLPAR